jgi:hypothetical protein
MYNDELYALAQMTKEAAMRPRQAPAKPRNAVSQAASNAAMDARQFANEIPGRAQGAYNEALTYAKGVPGKAQGVYQRGLGALNGAVEGGALNMAAAAEKYAPRVGGRIGSAILNNPRTAVIGAGLAGLGALGGAAYGANQYFNKEASFADPASEVIMAKVAAEHMYEDALRNLDYAEQLYAEANEAMYKMASDNGPGENVGWINSLSSQVGATVSGIPQAGAELAQRLAAGANGAINNVKGAAGAGIVASAGALQAFQDQYRVARAQQHQANIIAQNQTH